MRYLQNRLRCQEDTPYYSHCNGQPNPNKPPCAGALFEMKAPVPNGIEHK